MGRQASERTEALQAKGDYSESYFTHGLSVSAAEGLAELTHQRVRAALDIGEETGKRYSWGYPSCPDLSQHVLVDKLLDMSQIGVEVTGIREEVERTPIEERLGGRLLDHVDRLTQLALEVLDRRRVRELVAVFLEHPVRLVIRPIATEPRGQRLDERCLPDPMRPRYRDSHPRP